MSQMNTSDVTPRLRNFPCEILLMIFSNLSSRCLKIIRLDRQLYGVATEALSGHMEYLFSGPGSIMEEMLLRMYGQEHITSLVKSITVRIEGSLRDLEKNGIFASGALALPLRALSKMVNLHTLTFVGDWSHKLINHDPEQATLRSIKILNFGNQNFVITHDDDNKEKEIIIRQRQRVVGRSECFNMNHLIDELMSFGSAALTYWGRGQGCYSLRSLTIHDRCPEIQDLADFIGKGTLQTLDMVDAILNVKYQAKLSEWEQDDHCCCPFFTLLDALGERWQSGKLPKLRYKITNVTKFGWEGALNLDQDELEACWAKKDDKLTSEFVNSKLAHVQLDPERYEVMPTDDPNVAGSLIRGSGYIFEASGYCGSGPCRLRPYWSYEEAKNARGGEPFEGISSGEDMTADGLFPHIETQWILIIKRVISDNFARLDIGSSWRRSPSDSYLTSSFPQDTTHRH